MLRAALPVLLIALTCGAHAATLTLDETIEYQTIDGFGGFNADNDADALVNDLGITIHRGELNPDGTPSPGWSVLRNVKNAGCTKFIFSVWSPPASMKTNGSVTDGGNLKPSQYAAFGNYCATFLKQFKQEVGIDCYAFSPQNEAEFVEPYASCVYTAETYRDMITVIGPILKAECPNTMIFGPETMSHTMGAMQAVTLNDPDANPYLNAIAVHGYSDGVSPSSPSANVWSKAARMAASYDRRLWMTETSGQADNWSGAMDLAGGIYVSLYYGDLNAWVFWRLTQTADWQANTRWLISSSGRKTQRYYASKQYYKYVRPGAVRVESLSDDIDVLPTAFHHKQNRTLTIVVINNASSSRALNLAGANVPSQFTRYLSSSSKNCSNEGTASSSSISLPASSITTLVADNYDGRSAVATDSPQPPSLRAPRPAAAPAGMMYTIDGRRAGRRGGACGVVVFSGGRMAVGRIVR